MEGSGQDARLAVFPNVSITGFLFNNVVALVGRNPPHKHIAFNNLAALASY